MPVSLQIFLTALAIIDDLGAVAIIAAFYTADLSLAWLGLAGSTLAVLAGLNRAGVERLAFSLGLGVLLWVFVLKSGVHATLAGVALALTIPLRPSPGRPDDPASPLHILEHALHPWVAYLIVPAFGFANAGVSLSGMSWAAVLAPLPLGIAAGLFVGKQIGIFLTTWAAATLHWAERPEHATWPQVYGVSLLCGIGFTMSLFIGLLAFPIAPDLQDEVKIGVRPAPCCQLWSGPSYCGSRGLTASEATEPNCGYPDRREGRDEEPCSLDCIWRVVGGATDALHGVMYVERRL